MGKAIGAENISTFHALTTGKRVDVYSMEMRRHAWMRRAWASTARLQFQHLQKPHLIVEDEWSKIMHAQERLAASRLNIDDTPGLTAAQLIARAERQQLRDPTSLIVIDNLSEIVLPGRDRTDIELGNACKGFSRMGKKFGVPVILLVHVNRDVTKGSDKRPTMAHLRNSGEIEQIADLILMLHREDYYNRETHLKKVVEMIVGKGRDIPTGEIIYLENIFSEMRMTEWEGALPKAAPKPEKPPKKTLASESKDYAGRRGE
jgi:replicative DNA helicase